MGSKCSRHSDDMAGTAVDPAHEDSGATPMPSKTTAPTSAVCSEMDAAHDRGAVGGFGRRSSRARLTGRGSCDEP
jgi:hypothetical protein